ncbi:hypothetical protein Poli38472_004670 [Pythium oligandrum]|uniref:E3 UFM1-protein ligase 1 n=1 Tax=Pythium oligandrum TaxID=41045 RepID=A0A8K1CAB2_PYTOL|nr:hypothetical protein Poli38472_004670 [Pythium oligandrum]|eukprot:TMW59601.1 hypothetical protein Poli38472_004670 [Pythium oligandrum]
MDEIAALQAQLAAVQQQESALKLSDHNVIDLLAKLQQLGKIQIVHTLTGKQILTPKQIEHEIEDHVTLNAGRISLSELQQLLSIDRTYVERGVTQLAKSSRHASGVNASQFYVVNNGEEVITNWYLDAIMEDTNTLLQDSGTMTIGELAQQYGFAVEYMKDVVASRLGSILKAQERSNILYTNSFVESQKAQIRGVFTAISRPTFVPDIVRSHRFEDKVVEEYLNELIQRRVLMGTLRGREYVPYVFVEAQRESMYSFFQQNGYLDNARANQLQVTRPYDFLKKRFPDAVPLKDCVVSHALQLQVEGSIEVAVNDASFVDLRTILPSAIHTVDVSLLLSKSALVGGKGSGEAVQLNEVYAVSKAFLSSCLEALKQDAVAKAKQASLQQRTAGASAPKESQDNAEVDDDDDDEDLGGKRGKKGKKGGKAAVDDAPSDKKSKRGKGSKAADESKAKGAKGKRGKKGGGDEPDSKRSNATASITPTREQVIELLTSSFSQVEDDEELLEGIADHLEGEIEKMYATELATALSSILRGDAASLRDLRKKFEDQFDELYAMLTIYEKGFNKLELQVDAKDTVGMEQLKGVEVHLLETAGIEVASLVTSFVAASHNLEMEDVPAFEITPSASKDENAAESTVPKLMSALSDDNKKILEKNLSPSTATALVRLWTFVTAGRRSFGDFMTHIPVVVDALSMPLRKVDRKKERQILFGHRHNTIGALEDVADEEYGKVVALIMEIFFQQTTGLVTALPQDKIDVASSVLRAFASTVPEAPLERLQEFVTVAQMLVDGNEDRAAEWKQLIEGARTLVVAKDMGEAFSKMQESA